MDFIDWKIIYDCAQFSASLASIVAAFVAWWAMVSSKRMTVIAEVQNEAMKSTLSAIKQQNIISLNEAKRRVYESTVKSLLNGLNIDLMILAKLGHKQITPEMAENAFRDATNIQREMAVAIAQTEYVFSKKLMNQELP